MTTSLTLTDDQVELLGRATCVVEQLPVGRRTSVTRAQLDEFYERPITDDEWARVKASPFWLAKEAVIR